MNDRKFILALSTLLIAAFCLTGLLPQANAQSPASMLSAAVRRARQLYGTSDPQLAREFKELAEKNPSDLEVNAWYVWHFAASLRQPPEGVVERMKKLSPESPWTILASAAEASLEQAKPLVEKAMQKGKDDEGVLLLATQVMSRLASFEGSADSLKAFVAAHKAGYERSAEGLTAQAAALEHIALQEGSDNKVAVAELASRALKLDPGNLRATHQLSDSLAKQQKPKENYEFLRSAMQVSPDDFFLHYSYWKAIRALPGTKADEHQKEIGADVTQFLSRKQPSAYTVRLLFSVLNDFPELLTNAGDLILKQYPDSAASDAVLYQRADQDLPLATKEQNTLTKIKALEAFVDRPKHYDEDIFQAAHVSLAYYYATQEKPDPERFYKAISVGGPSASWLIKLADQKARLAELERMALKGLDNRWAQLKLYADKLHEKRLKAVVGSASAGAAEWQDALGWIYFQQGKLAEAQEKLELAARLNPRDLMTTIHLGRLFEAKGDLARAEQFYSDSMGKEYYGEGDHPAVALLRQLYVRKRGNAVGLEAYMKPIIERGREIRKSNILARRVADPKPMSSFTLTTLKGENITSESLKGKILVINFWATWCGPCRAEMPDIQKFYDKYKNDPHVVFLSMTVDEPETPNQNVEAYLTKNKYTFPVLRAYEYGRGNGINGIPETWFVDASGNRVFEGIPGSKDLVEEFTWRVESLRAEANKSKGTK